MLFVVAAVLAGALEYGNRMTKIGGQVTNTYFSAFKNNYLLVYSLMMGGFWDALACASSAPAACAPASVLLEPY